MKTFWIVALTATFLCAAQAGDNDSSAAPAVSELDQLKARIAAQQAQIDQLKQILADQSAALDKLATQSKPSGPGFPSSGQVASTTAVVPPTPDPAPKPDPLPVVPPAPAPQGDQPSPLQIKLGDATITPIGFMDITNTWRSTNAGTSLQTNFGSFPYNNATAGRLTEDKWSAENSRIGFRVDVPVKGANVLGYFEGDFVGLGSAALNSQVSSNSMLFRIRQYYVDVRKGFWEVLAGQAWSLIVPNRAGAGINPLPSSLFYGQAVDVNYLVGLTWGRIPGIRFIGHPSDKVNFAIALENSTQYFGGSGGGGVPTLPAALATAYNAEVDNSVNNDRTIPNVAPDILAKIAIEPTKRVHFELNGVTNQVKLWNPNTNQYFTKVGAGGSFNFNIGLTKNLNIVSNNFWSDGDGRYLFGAYPNFIVRADGSPSLMHSGSTLNGIEARVKKVQMYAYYGGEIGERNTAFDLDGKTRIGYGFTGSANSQNRAIQEVTFGWIHTLWQDGKFGALQYMTQYAYFTRDPWYVALNAPKNTHEHAIWFNLRYVLPGTAPTIKY